MSSTTNNQMWVYYPALNAWSIITGQNIAKFATVKFNNEQRLYGVDGVTGKLYRLFYGTNDDDVAINLNLKFNNNRYHHHHHYY